MQPSDLKECPFCGGTALVREVRISDMPLPQYTVECDGCKASSGCLPQPDRAVASWNRRAALNQEGQGDGE